MDKVADKIVQYVTGATELIEISAFIPYKTSFNFKFVKLGGKKLNLSTYLVNRIIIRIEKEHIQQSTFMWVVCAQYEMSCQILKLACTPTHRSYLGPINGSKQYSTFAIPGLHMITL